MSGNAGNQRIIPLEEGWNDEIKAKVRLVLVTKVTIQFSTRVQDRFTTISIRPARPFRVFFVNII